MTTEHDQDAHYVLGHSERELERLERQAAFFAENTRDLLLRAGIRPGMRVLDVGCGVGDVSTILADIVGPNGEVLGVDTSADALAIAEARLKAAGKAQVRFSQGSIENLEDLGGFDAIVGRFILIHIADPSALIRNLAEKAGPGTVIAFVEMDMSTAAALPPLPLLGRQIESIMEVYRRTGRQADTGAHLFQTFRAAGLTPAMAGLTRISSAEDVAGFAFVTESVRSLLPAMEKLGITTAAEVEIDSLRERLLAEAGGGDHCIFYPRLVGAWAEAKAIS